jgi:hypothetical protein
VINVRDNRAVLIADLRHFLDGQGRIAPTQGPAKTLADFLTNVVATMTHDFDSPLGPIHCRRRPNRKPCSGLVDATLTTDNSIAWRCKACGDEGVIMHWQNSFWDMTDAPISDASSG